MKIHHVHGTILDFTEQLKGLPMQEHRNIHTPTQNQVASTLELYVWILFFLIITSVFQFSIPYPVDPDTAYHFAVGRLIRFHGILHSFPWTRFSWQFDHYADKEFLFHLMFVPLSGLEPLTASRIVGVVCGTGLLTTICMILRTEKVKHAGVYALLPLMTCVFFYRFAQVRPHLLSIILAFIILWSIVREKHGITFIFSLLYPLAYVAFWQMPMILIVSAYSARILAGKMIHWKSTAAALAGITCGVILHPNSYNLLEINWIHMVDILMSNALGENPVINLGYEFIPYSIVEWGKFLALVVIMAATAITLGWRERDRDTAPLAFSLAALFFGSLTIMTSRFVEYFVPFTVVAFALSTRTTRTRYLTAGIVVFSFCYLALFGTGTIRETITMGKNNVMENSTKLNFQQLIPVGSQVFTTSWHYTGELMQDLPEREFLVAADPTLLYKEDPYLYRMWIHLTFHAPDNTAEYIRKLFKSRFVISQKDPIYDNFFHTLLMDPGVKLLYQDTDWLLFDLGAGS